jgi:hypothetical protein
VDSGEIVFTLSREAALENRIVLTLIAGNGPSQITLNAPPNLTTSVDTYRIGKNARYAVSFATGRLTINATNVLALDDAGLTRPDNDFDDLVIATSQGRFVRSGDVLLFEAGDVPTSPDPECCRESDCGATESCVFGVCRPDPECFSDGDCPSTSSCRFGQCRFDCTKPGTFCE